MIVYSDRNFSVCLCAEEGIRFTLIARERREFYRLEGARCLVEGGMHELLRSILVEGIGKELSDRWGVDENRISNLRKALDEVRPRGRVKEVIRDTGRSSLERDQRVRWVGSERSSILIITKTPTAWVLVPATNIVLEGRASPRVSRWLYQRPVAQAAEQLQINLKRVTVLRKFLPARI